MEPAVVTVWGALEALADSAGIVTGAMRAEATIAPAARICLIMRSLHVVMVAPWAVPGPPDHRIDASKRHRDDAELKLHASEKDLE